jgi:hypothetical protein
MNEKPAEAAARDLAVRALTELEREDPSFTSLSDEAQAEKGIARAQEILAAAKAEPEGKVGAGQSIITGVARNLTRQVDDAARSRAERLERQIDGRVPIKQEDMVAVLRERSRRATKSTSSADAEPAHVRSFESSVGDIVRGSRTKSKPAGTKKAREVEFPVQFKILEVK